MCKKISISNRHYFSEVGNYQILDKTLGKQHFKIIDLLTKIGLFCLLLAKTKIIIFLIKHHDTSFEIHSKLGLVFKNVCCATHSTSQDIQVWCQGLTFVSVSCHQIQWNCCIYCLTQWEKLILISGCYENHCENWFCDSRRKWGWFYQIYIYIGALKTALKTTLDVMVCYHTCKPQNTTSPEKVIFRNCMMKYVTKIWHLQYILSVNHAFLKTDFVPYPMSCLEQGYIIT